MYGTVIAQKNWMVFLNSCVAREFLFSVPRLFVAVYIWLHHMKAQCLLFFFF